MIDVKPVLLLTATVDPGGYSTFLYCSDTNARALEYAKSLFFWLNLDPCPYSGIVFCENSGVDLSVIKSLLLNRFALSQEQLLTIEWCSFSGNQRPQSVHYGYSELGIIDYALSNSELLNSNTHFIKATGRLTFPQINALIESLPDTYDFILDYHRYKMDENFPRRVRTQIFFSNVNFYKVKLLGVREKMNEDISFIEELFAKELWGLRENHEIFCRLPRECMPSGVSASIGSRYESLPNKLKSVVRGFCRKAFPSFWL